ncbi:MAG TPA: transposase [bacterium]|nr:transposase [bacterium]
MGRDRYKVVGKSPHFLTCTTVGWITVFNDPGVVSITIDSLNYLQEQERLFLNGYVIMENHIHLVASSDNLSAAMHDFKSYTAHKIVEHLKSGYKKGLLEQLTANKVAHKADREYQVWQEGSHPEVILDLEMLEQKLNYIHFNPVRRGYVDKPEHWRYSSARDYMGIKGLLPLKGREKM